MKRKITHPRLPLGVQFHELPTPCLFQEMKGCAVWLKTEPGRAMFLPDGLPLDWPPSERVRLYNGEVTLSNA